MVPINMEVVYEFLVYAYYRFIFSKQINPGPKFESSYIECKYSW